MKEIILWSDSKYNLAGKNVDGVPIRSKNCEGEWTSDVYLQEGDTITLHNCSLRKQPTREVITYERINGRLGHAITKYI